MSWGKDLNQENPKADGTNSHKEEHLEIIVLRVPCWIKVTQEVFFKVQLKKAEASVVMVQATAQAGSRVRQNHRRLHQGTGRATEARQCVVSAGLGTCMELLSS